MRRTGNYGNYERAPSLRSSKSNKGGLTKGHIPTARVGLLWGGQAVRLPGLACGNTRSGRTIERIRRPSYGSLEIELTVDDPKVYTRPWHAKRYMHIMLDTELIEDICNENERSLTHIFYEIAKLNKT